MKTRIRADKKQVFDPVRRKWVAMVPEEHVRQSVLEFLTGYLRVPWTLIGVEYSLSNIEPGNRRQVDILIWKPGVPGENVPLKPWLLVECKAPAVKITEELKYQISRYLSVIPSEFLMLTNGKDNRYFRLTDRKYTVIDRLPFFSQ